MTRCWYCATQPSLLRQLARFHKCFIRIDTVRRTVPVVVRSKLKESRFRKFGSSFRSSSVAVRCDFLALGPAANPRCLVQHCVAVPRYCIGSVIDWSVHGRNSVKESCSSFRTFCDCVFWRALDPTIAVRLCSPIPFVAPATFCAAVSRFVVLVGPSVPGPSVWWPFDAIIARSCYQPDRCPVQRFLRGCPMVASIVCFAAVSAIVWCRAARSLGLVRWFSSRFSRVFALCGTPRRSHRASSVAAFWMAEMSPDTTGRAI